MKSAILMFNRNKKLRKNLKVTRDFLLYKKINDILWFDWDHLRLNEFAPKDEYQSYAPEILGIVKATADRHVIAERLHKLKTEIMGMSGTKEN